ncbi:MAG: FtsX-like permease family protein [Longimicrobiaceae bacterium]
MKLEWTIARRYLSSRHGARFLSLITLISIGGVAVGVMALILVTSVMNGLTGELRAKILGSNPHIWLTTYGQVMALEEWPETAERAREVEGVVAVAPFVHGEVALRNRAGYAEAAVLRGIDPGAPGEPVTDMSRWAREGRLDLGTTESGYPPLLVGQGLADRFGLFAGDVVDVISFQGVEVGSLGGLIPPMRKFEVAGRFRTGMFEYDNKFMYTTLEAAQDVARMDDQVTGLEIRVADVMASDRVAARLQERLGFPFRADDWKAMNAALFSALQLEKLALGLILLLIVVVAAFNIVSTLVMMVADKTREVGILKSMGFTSQRVLRVFMVQGLVIGSVGATIGGSLGLLTAWLVDRYELISLPPDVYFIDRLPVRVSPLDVLLIMGAAVLISFLATIHPARRAARLEPVEAIRDE